MKTPKQAREKARWLLANWRATHDYYLMNATAKRRHDDLQDRITTAILDAQREAVKEAVEFVEVAFDAFIHQLTEAGTCSPNCFKCRAEQFLTTYEQRNDEGREG